MRFQCGENYGVRGCSRLAIEGEEYCRWHLNVRHLQKEAGAWGEFLAYIFAGTGVGCGVWSLVSLWSFARTPTVKLLLEVIFAISFLIWLLSYALILLDKRYALFAQLLAWAMGGVGCIFFYLDVRN